MLFQTRKYFMYYMHVVVSPSECVGPMYVWDPYTMTGMLRVSNTYGTTSFPNKVVLCVNSVESTPCERMFHATCYTK